MSIWKEGKGGSSNTVCGSITVAASSTGRSINQGLYYGGGQNSVTLWIDVMVLLLLIMMLIHHTLHTTRRHTSPDMLHDKVNKYTEIGCNTQWLRCGTICCVYCCSREVVSTSSVTF